MFECRKKFAAVETFPKASVSRRVAQIDSREVDF